MEEDFSTCLAGTVEDAWRRSLEVWRKRGRVEDYPKGVRMPKYSPDSGKRLGEAFAEKFATDQLFVTNRLSSADPVEAACAYDILEFIFKVWLRRRREAEAYIQGDLLELRMKLPGEILDEIRSDRIYKDFQGTTIGEFFRFIETIGEY
jgi:hypothetical protein